MPPSKKRPNRAQYDLTPDLKQRIKDLSLEIGVPESQIAAMLLMMSLDELEGDAVEWSSLLTKSNSPKYRYNIDLDEVARRYWKGRDK